jgi:hypothetical protein
MTSGRDEAKPKGLQIDHITIKFERPFESMMTELAPCIDQHGEYANVCSTSLCVEELDDFATIIGKSRNLPKIFRNIVTYAEFDAHRIKTLLELHKTYSSKKERFSILSPNKVRISLFAGSAENGSYLGDINVVWKWRFSLLGSCGAEDLMIESVNVVCDSSSDQHSAAYAILNDLKDQGLYYLLSSLGGDCTKALKLLLKITSV